MRETSFIEQNKEKWREFEQLISQKKKDPDKLSELFVQITDDLSYSRTFYPKRSVKVYLNNLAQKVFVKIYKNKKEKGNRFIYFWKEELPRVVYESRKTFLLSFLIFLFAFAVGVLSSIYNPDFARVILGDSYVNMTIENIESGDPMAVYKKSGETEMFLQITMNNLRVDFMVFVFGLLFGIGSIAIMIYNGVMVGTFQYFFYERGLFLESFLTIWQHGTIEISTIIICGAAGITLGKGLVFPGTYSRLYAFQVSAVRGLKILMGIVPLTIFAGLIEGFVTRHTEVPDFVRLLVILFSLLFIVLYFVWYPYVKAKRGFPEKTKKETLAPTRTQNIDFGKLKKNAEAFTDTFIFLKKHRKKLGKALALVALLSGVLLSLIRYGFGNAVLYYQSVLPTQQLSLYFSYRYALLPALINILSFTFISLYVHYFLVKESTPGTSTPSFRAHLKKHVVKLLGAVTLHHLLLFIPGFWGKFLFILFIPVLGIWAFSLQKEQEPFGKSLGRSFSIFSATFSKSIEFFVMLAIVATLILFFINSPLLWLYLEFANWFLAFNSDRMQWLINLFFQFLTVFSVGIAYTLFLGGFGIVFFSLREIKEATFLRQQVDAFGIKEDT